MDEGNEIGRIYRKEGVDRNNNKEYKNREK